MSASAAPSFISGPEILAPLVSFVVSGIVLVTILRHWSDRILDYPNKRSLHKRPVPRVGGVGVLAGIAASVPIVSPSHWWPLWCCAVILMALSFLDDSVGLPVAARLMMHFVIASIAVITLYPGQTATVDVVSIIVATVWMINLYNFMDGMDGLAGGMSWFGFGFMAIAAFINDSGQLAVISAAIAGSAAAFLVFNFPPARLFLGDTGSTTLGFLAAGIGLIGWREGVWSLWFPCLVFSPFIVDATVTLVRRIARREKFWQAHRSHYYQRLVLSGWGQRRTVLVEYGIMIVSGATALLIERTTLPYKVLLLGMYGSLCVILLMAVDRVGLSRRQDQ